jgi:AbrB family looped-hinge helix DNA binding protein
MSKVTSKLQVTVPKAIADHYKIQPGDAIEWVAAGDTIRIVPPGRAHLPLDREMSLKLFDAATERQRRRQSGQAKKRVPCSRGWTREDLYDRGRSR